MTRPVSGSAVPPPPPRLNRPMLTFDPRPPLEIEPELRSFWENSLGVATAAVKSVSLRQLVGVVVDRSISASSRHRHA